MSRDTALKIGQTVLFVQAFTNIGERFYSGAYKKTAELSYRNKQKNDTGQKHWR